MHELHPQFTKYDYFVRLLLTESESDYDFMGKKNEKRNALPHLLTSMMNTFSKINLLTLVNDREIMVCELFIFYYIHTYIHIYMV